MDVAIKKFGPSAIRGAILGLCGLLAARSEILAPMGIIYDQATRVLTVHFDQVSLWAMLLLPAVGAGAIKVLNHHSKEVVKTIVAKEIG